ncbi:DUF2851 family protein [Soonwooa purpurea]
MIKEDFLQYLWSKKLFENYDFVSTKGFPIEILNYGQWNHNQGPDFLFAQIKYQDTIFAGHIELHVKSSDWYFHKHSQQEDYQNIILHVVYKDDCDIDLLVEKNIPTLEIKQYIDNKKLSTFNQMDLEHFKFIPCEELITQEKVPLFFHEEKLLEKLSQKSESIKNQLSETKNDYEAVLFINLAYAFGLKINADIFKQLAESIDYSVIKKIRQNPTALEALFFGLCGWLESPKDDMMKIWAREFQFLKSKFNLSNITLNPKFSKLRPPNFPNIRLSQLAQLLSREPHLFSKIKMAKNITELKTIFLDIKASEYWDTHFNFGKISSENSLKKLSDEFVERLLINTILPTKYCLELECNENINDEIIKFYQDLKTEKNSVIDTWESFGIISKSALETQSLLQHYKTFCNEKKCLNCGIGYNILKHD